MKKYTAIASTLALLALTPLSWSEDFCPEIMVGRADGALTGFPPLSKTSTPPNTGDLWIQIHTTMPLATVLGTLNDGTTLTHQCAIASDLAEVDLMMRDIGFAGHAMNVLPLFTNTYIEFVSSNQDQDFLRDVVAEVLSPNGQPDARLNELAANPALFTPEVLNIYYVDFPDDYLETLEEDPTAIFTGFHVRGDEGKSDRMIFVSDASHADTLAHEFGHALSAGHVNFWDFDGEIWCAKYLPDPDSIDPEDVMENMDCEFSKRNYMWAASGMDRQQLGNSQKVRMMHNEKSLITEFSTPAPTKDCPDFSNDPVEGCPRLKGFEP